MDLLIKQARIVHPGSPYHNQISDILISDGVISKIESEIQEDVDTLSGDGLFCSPGWVDMCASLGDPGYEHKENFRSGLLAAAQGGFTEVCISPVTNPVLQDKTGVEYVKAASKDQLVNAHAIGGLTEGLKGENITEFLEMNEAGALAFYQGGSGPENAGVLLRALLYAKMFNGLIYLLPEDGGIQAGGQMHEGLVSTRLGMKGIPAFAEKIRIQRDIELLQYTNGKAHFLNISSKSGMELLKKLEPGLKGRLSTGLAAHQLYFSDNDLTEFDANLKVQPPFRSEDDREALRKGVLEGTVDCIISDHQPQDIESKFLEFQLADNGIASLEYTFGMLNAAIDISPERNVELLSLNPRKILGMDIPKIAEGERANLSLFTMEEWTGENLVSVSKAYNKPFVGRKLRGRVQAVVNNGQLVRANWN